MSTETTTRDDIPYEDIPEDESRPTQRFHESKHGSHSVSSSNHLLIDRIIDRMKNELRDEFPKGSHFGKEGLKGRNIAVYIGSNDEEDLDQACRELGCNRSQFMRLATRIACKVVLNIPQVEPEPVQVESKGTVTRKLTEDERHMQQLAREWPILEIDHRRKQVRYAMKKGFYDQLKQTVTIDITMEEEVRTELEQEAKATQEAST